jgi:hypothetical protein
MKDLGASVVTDDQNVHLTGPGLFPATAAPPRVEYDRPTAEPVSVTMIGQPRWQDGA